MKVTIEIGCDNAAFDIENGGPGPELSYILRMLAAKLENYSGGLPTVLNIGLRDSNGNTVGGLRVGD